MKTAPAVAPPDHPDAAELLPDGGRRHRSHRAASFWTVFQLRAVPRAASFRSTSTTALEFPMPSGNTIYRWRPSACSLSGPGDRGLQRLHVCRDEGRLEARDEEVAGILLRLGGERIRRDDGPPLVRGAHVELDGEAEALGQRRFEQALQRRRVLGRSAEHHVAALQEGGDVAEPELRESGPQVGHRDHLVAADVDAAQEADVGGHRLPHAEDCFRRTASAGIVEEVFPPAAAWAGARKVTVAPPNRSRGLLPPSRSRPRHRLYAQSDAAGSAAVGAGTCPARNSSSRTILIGGAPLSHRRRSLSSIAPGGSLPSSRSRSTSR